MRIVVAMTGATGAVYGVRLLETLNVLGVETHLVLSRWAEVTISIIAPPVPAFYQNPQTVDDLVDHTVGRVLDVFGLEMPGLERWPGTAPADPSAEAAT